MTREGIRHSDIPAAPAVRLGVSGRAVEEVAAEACQARDAFQVVFIHADTGGRAIEEGLQRRAANYCRKMYELCAWPAERCVTVSPRHETEAWVLADPKAITAALGFRGNHRDVGLPDDARHAERLPNPKSILAEAMRLIGGNKRRIKKVEQLFPAIAQRQDLSALRGSESFRIFEGQLKQCLADLGCIPRQGN